MVTRIEPNAGTVEEEWSAWGAPGRWPRLDPDELAGTPVVVLAAHPDDETLGVGGLVCLLARAGARLSVVWATDGEASHPGSVAAAGCDLAAERRGEADAALAALGADRAPRIRLGLPDGDVAGHEQRLTETLGDLVPPGAAVLTPWSGDAHPDHEACGRAARAVTDRVLEYPVWAWSWARPDDPRVPWARAVRVELPTEVRDRKAAAVDCFGTQVRPLGPEPADGPVLPPRVLAHFGRGYEVLMR